MISWTEHNKRLFSDSVSLGTFLALVIASAIYGTSVSLILAALALMPIVIRHLLFTGPLSGPVRGIEHGIWIYWIFAALWIVAREFAFGLGLGGLTATGVAMLLMPCLAILGLIVFFIGFRAYQVYMEHKLGPDGYLFHWMSKKPQYRRAMDWVSTTPSFTEGELANALDWMPNQAAAFMYTLKSRQMLDDDSLGSRYHINYKGVMFAERFRSNEIA